MKWPILIIIISLTIQSDLTKTKIEVDYEKNKDIITIGNKTYIPLIAESTEATYLQTKLPEKTSLASEKPKEKDSCEEELVRGPQMLFFMLMIAFLTLFAGMMSGLTVGYLSIDDLVMELRLTSGTEEEKKYANLVLPVLSNRHWLLVTLLLMNSFAMEALPVFLDRIVNRVLAVIISVTLILAFGEVIPQAVCTGPDQVKIAAFLAPLTKFLMIISWPLSFWIGKALDVILGEHHKIRYLNSDLKALVELHTFKALKELQEEEEKHYYIPKEDIAKPSDKMGLNDVEANLMLGALEMRNKTVTEIFIPFKDVFILNYEDKIDQFKLKLILEKGFSRIPVYQNNNPNDLIGILRLKQLVSIDVTQKKSLKELKVQLKPPIVVHPSTKILDIFQEFLKGKSHLAFVTEQVEKLQDKLGLNRSNSLAVENKFMFSQKGDLGAIILGIVTLEDVLEVMFKQQIKDEEDYEKEKYPNRTLSKLMGRAPSRLQMMMSGNKEAKENFISEQTKTLEKLIKETHQKKNEKEEFLELSTPLMKGN